MVGTYHPGLPNIAVFCSVELQPLLLCSDKCKNLGDYLVHAKLNPTRRTGQKRKGTVRCGNRRCHVCKYLEPGDRFTSQNTGKSSVFTYNFELDCNSSHVVYFLPCKVCTILWFNYNKIQCRKLIFLLNFLNQRTLFIFLICLILVTVQFFIKFKLTVNDRLSAATRISAALE